MVEGYPHGGALSPKWRRVQAWLRLCRDLSGRHACIGHELALRTHTCTHTPFGLLCFALLCFALLAFDACTIHCANVMLVLVVVVVAVVAVALVVGFGGGSSRGSRCSCCPLGAGEMLRL